MFVARSAQKIWSGNVGDSNRRVHEEEFAVKKRASILTITILVVLVLINVCLAADSSVPVRPWAEVLDAAPTEKPLIDKTVAFISAGTDDLYAVYKNAFTYFVEQAGGKVVYAVSDMNEQKELDNVANFISAGVDAIVLITVGATAGGESCQLANNGGVPIFIGSQQPDVSQNGATYVSYAKTDWHGLGWMSGLYTGEWALKNKPDAKFITIDGVLAQSGAYWFREGFNDAVESLGYPRPKSMGEGMWTRDGALKIMQDTIVSGIEWDICYFGNEEMLEGGLQALQEAGILVGEKNRGKILTSTNGKSSTMPLIKEGLVMCVGSNAPTLMADILYQSILRYFLGYPVQQDVQIAAAELITIENVDRAVSWNIDEFLEQVKNHVIEHNYEVIRDQYNERQKAASANAGTNNK
jgi:ABC-type sugar transport system substrate-binding protein